MKSYDPQMHSAEHILNQTTRYSIRIISVGDYDHCPCIEPHVGNTSDIGQFQLVSTSFEEGVLRIRFKLN